MSPGTQAPLRKCARLLLSTYLKKGEEQKEVQEAKDEEEEESEIDGEVVTQRTDETWQ